MPQSGSRVTAGGTAGGTAGAGAVPRDGTGADHEPGPPFDTGHAYEKHPKVAIRREAFGALAYHYGNRRLVFLKSPALADVVERLGEFPSAADALAARVPDGQRGAYCRALSGLLASGVIRAR